MRFLIILFLLFPGFIQAQPILYLSDSIEEIELGKYGSHVLRANRELNIKQLLPLNKSAYIPNSNGLLFFEQNIDLPDVWLRFDLMYTGIKSNQVLVELNNPLIDEVSFYLVQNNRVIDSNHCGDDIPFTNRNIHFRNPVFSIWFEPNQFYSLYIRCNADGRKMHLPIIMRSVNNFVERSSSKDLMLGLFYGILISLTWVYFYLALIIKERSFLFLALYLFFLTLSQLAVSGVDYAYLWPSSSYWNNRSVAVFMGLAIIMGLYFARLFLSKRLSNWILWPFRFLLAAAIFSVVLSLGSDQMLHAGMNLLYFLIPLDYGLLFLVGSYYLIKRIKVARFFVLSFFAATISIGLMVYYSISNNIDNVYTNNLVLYALILKCLMLSIAMFDRVKIFKEENELAQKSIIQNLEELAQYKESVNQELALRIHEKTQELIGKKNEVNLAIIQGEERERKRIAQELHDGMGSLLATLKLNVESLNLENKGLSSFEWKAYKGLLELVDYACVELRDISHNMLPAGIEHFGLEATLKSDIAKIKRHKNLQIGLDTFGLINIQNKEIELHVYRIVLELLNNVIKHAQASQANIQLMLIDKHLSLIVEDNGVGFNPENTLNSGIGIISVKSRVEALLGKMQIDSMKHRGTSITIEIPIP